MAGRFRLLLALGAVLVALILTLLLRPWISDTLLTFFYGAALLAGVLGGPAAALVAIVASLVAAELFVFEPGAFAAFSGATLLRDVVFAGVSLSIALLAFGVKQARERAESRTDEADRSVQRGERLQRFTSVLLQHVGASAVARAIVTEGRSAVDASAAAIVLVRDAGGYDVVASEESLVGKLNPSLAGYVEPGPVTDVLRTGEAVWLEGPEDLERRYPDLARAAARDGAVWSALPLRIEERLIGVLLLASTAPDAALQVNRSYRTLVAQQCAQALERGRLYEMELQARVRAEFAERRLAFLSEASSRLAASLDYASTLSDLAQLSVPEVADWCLIYLVNENGRVGLVAGAHADPARTQLRRSLDEKFPGAQLLDGAVRTVLASGLPQHVPHVSAADEEAAAHDAGHLEGLRALGTRSYVAAPISAAGRVAGVFVIASAESGRILTASDVTLAEELGRRAGQAVENARLYQAAQHANETKSDFLAVVSHELRTPLNAIIGYSDLLLMGVPEAVPDRPRRQVERIRSASTSLLQLVEEVLSFSRIEAGKEAIRISPVDVTAAVQDCVTMIEPLAAEKGLDLDVDVPDTPLKLVSDEHKIRQIVTNLLSNAVKFTESGSVTVRVFERDGELNVHVRDTGIGIPAEHMDRIFEPFWQVEQSSTRRFGGTGLGLGVARKLAMLLEGRLEVESAEGEGSLFKLTLPLRTPLGLRAE